MNERVCKLPETDELKKLLVEDRNIIWYMRCPQIEGSQSAKRILKEHIEIFRKRKEKN